MRSRSRAALSDAPQDRWAHPPEAGDRRFTSPEWTRWPFQVLAQMQLAAEAAWRGLSDVRGVDSHHARRVEFMGRFLLGLLAPVNFPLTNPEVVRAALRSGGANFLAGAALLADDVAGFSGAKRSTRLNDYQVGLNMAVTPGAVVYRNDLIELIQYTPTTSSVRRQPILIVSAWIMKYYILDLTPADSLVRFLVDQGFTVFVISWKNPGADMRGVGFDEYRVRGVLAALHAVSRIVPEETVHALGYCLGGTALAITAAAMNRDGDDRLASLTLLAAQTDFEEPGELSLFIDESQLALIDAMMEARGFLDAHQMAAAFYLLRAHDMVFAKLVSRYLLGETSTPKALDAWLADATRMPARMHSEYLHRLFLENAFAHGIYEVEGRPVALRDIRTPIFALGAERDHIAPWRSVYKVALYSSADTTFVLVGGGHNTSVVSPLDKPRAYYRVNHSACPSDYVDPDTWARSASKQEGSWWPEWVRWLNAHSVEGSTPPRSPGHPEPGLAPLAPAPGSYVLEA